MIAAIIQARMGSTRLPGKVMRQIDGLPLIHLLINRVSQAKLLDKILVATSTLPQDDIIATYLIEQGIEVFRGSESDVLDRYYKCAQSVRADTIVRLTGDCPLIDPQVVDDTLTLFLQSGADYAANTVPPDTGKYPNGSDVEVFSFDALRQAHYEAVDPNEREHVTFYFWKNPKKSFKTVQLDLNQNLSAYRITVDYPEDLEVVEYIVHELKKRGSFGHLKELIDILDKNQGMMCKNIGHSFDAGWSK